MPVWSATLPSTAAPRPPIPNANPKNTPEIIPKRCGINSCANTIIEDVADEMRHEPAPHTSSGTPPEEDSARRPGRGGRHDTANDSTPAAGPTESPHPRHNLEPPLPKPRPPRPGRPARIQSHSGSLPTAF